mmetsp:Transcript_7818/g.20799  ORF Transcript_7818/g.20799 Transcript_7818/m.20799 type:complete len:308 (+) Transcript_7818:665-1588(+)
MTSYTSGTTKRRPRIARSSANAGPTSEESSALRSLNSQDSRKRSWAVVGWYALHCRSRAASKRKPSRATGWLALGARFSSAVTPLPAAPDACAKLGSGNPTRMVRQRRASPTLPEWRQRSARTMRPSRGSSRPKIMGERPDSAPLRSELCSSCSAKSMMRYSCSAAASSGDSARFVALPLLDTVDCMMCPTGATGSLTAPPCSAAALVAPCTSAFARSRAASSLSRPPASALCTHTASAVGPAVGLACTPRAACCSSCDSLLRTEGLLARCRWALTRSSRGSMLVLKVTPAASSMKLSYPRTFLASL